MPTSRALLLALASVAAAAEAVKPVTFRDLAALEFGPDALEHQAVDGARVTVEAAVHRQPEQDCLVLRPESGAGIASVVTPFVKVEPGRTYRVQALIHALQAEPGTQVCVWIREYPEPIGRPLQPYPRTGVRDRVLKAHEKGLWVLRSQTFRTKKEARTVQVTLVVSGAPAVVQLASIRIADIARLKATGADAFGQTLVRVQKQAAARKRIVDRTLVFSRSQMKYGLERNYMRRWIDRPLLVDRSLRVPRKYVTPYPSYARIIDVVKLYDIDGLAFFPETKDRLGMFELTTRADPQHFRLLPEFLPSAELEGKAKLLEAALACRSTVRIGGKILITSYNSHALEPAEWQRVLDVLRSRFGDCFLFLPALAAPVRLKRDFGDRIPIAAEDIEVCKASLRSYLDVCDGIYFHYAAALKRPDRTFDEAFYRELFIPVFKAVLAEPAYSGKYFGLSAYHSHYNADLSLGLQEDGTRTLRASFAAAMDAQPDVIVMPEWDEVNENTCIRPTVYNSFTTQRILRHHMSRIRETPPSPNPGDDLALPNLMVSYRKLLTLGEKLEIELLNVPDGTENEPYRVTLQLLTHTGALVRDLGTATLEADQLAEKRFTLASEEFADHPALVPALTVVGYGANPPVRIDEGFHHIQLRPTWNWDYKWVKQPLRDLLRPKEVSLTFEEQEQPAPKGAAAPYLATASLACDEDIALAELLEDDDVVYAVDPSDEFSRGSADKVRLWIELRSLRQQDLKGSLELRGAACDWRFSSVPLHQPPESQDVTGNRVRFETAVGCHLRWVYAVMPAAAVDSATLVLDSNLAKLEIPIRRIVDNGIYSETHNDGFTVTVWDYWKQPDMPMHLNQRRLAFSVRVRPELRTSQFHLRATTKTGKTFRSRPFVAPSANTGPFADLRVYSDTAGGPVPVRVSQRRVPDCRYEFTAKYGSILHSTAGRAFWGQLGGYVDTSTGRGGNGGGASATLFRFGTYQYPADAHVTAPKWQEVEGDLCLEFDGVGNYLLLPREALPRHGPFTLAFEILPRTVEKPQLLFAHRAMHVSSLILSVQQGKLRGTFAAQGGGHYSFDSDLEIRAGEWSRVEAIHDFETMRLRVNGREQSFPCREPGLNIGPCVFGGYGTGGQYGDVPGNAWWFSGWLKSLRIAHSVLP